MEQYKEKLKIQNVTIAVCCIALFTFSVLSLLGEEGIVPFFNPIAGDSHWQSMWRGFISGAAIGILALMLFGLIRNILAMKDEKKLKKLYIKENDERLQKVCASAGAAAMQTTLLLGLAAVIIAGYFSITVSLTILVCVLSCSFITIGFKFYYNRKY